MHDECALFTRPCLVDKTKVERIGAGREVRILCVVLYCDGTPTVVDAFEVVLISLGGDVMVVATGEEECERVLVMV